MSDLPPVLTDGVVTLRPHRIDDVAGMTAMAADPEFARRTTVPTPYTHQDALDRIQRVRGQMAEGSGTYWAIEHESRFAGSVEVRKGPPPDIGYGLAPWARGRGLMSRAVRLATRWAFDEGGYPIVHWSTHAGNLASWRVAHACGFTFHGARPLSVPQRGELLDGWFASLQPHDAPTPRTTWWPVPVLVGKRVRLRPFADDDVSRMVEACSDPQSQWYLSNLPDPYTAADARRFIGRTRLDAALGTAVNWAVADPDDDRLLANVDVFRLADPMSPTGGEIGYWAHPDARGRGAVREAVGLVVEHAFTPVADGGLGRHRLQIGASWDNAASRAIAERAGFTLLGRHRQDGVVGRGQGQQLDDGAWYELLNPISPDSPAH